MNPVNYTSLDESILSVDESGHVTALHTGTGMVRALLNTGDYALIAVEVTCDHDHTTRTETPATCTEDGSVTVICDDCGEVLSTETLPATGHTTVVKNAKDATCTEPGYTGDKVCTVCGETVETGEVICGVLDRVRPAAVIAVDALAAGRLSRLLRTVPT